MDLSAAYDGSKRPQTRELQPLERDILTRILSDIIWSNGTRIRTFPVEEPLYQEMAEVLTPRED